MAMASMHISLPTLTPPNLRRVNRYCLQAQIRSSVIAMASSYKEIATSGVKVTDGEGNLPKVVLTGSNGSEADVYLSIWWMHFFLESTEWERSPFRET